MGRPVEGPRPAGGTLALAAAILNSCFLLTQARPIDVKTEPSKPWKGGELLMTPDGSAGFHICIWYRGGEGDTARIFTYMPSIPEQRNGPKFTGRERGGPLCSLRITPLVLNDTGKYTVLKFMRGADSEKGTVHLKVLVSGSRASNVDKGAISGIVVGALAGTVLLGVLL